MHITDTLRNLTTGLGTERDRLTRTHFHMRFLGPADLEAMYQGDWIAGKIIDAPANDMTREWRAWNAGPKHTRALLAEEARLDVRGKVNKALKMARLYGGSGLVMGTGDDRPSLPLDIAAMRRSGLQYLHALSRNEMFAGPLDRDPLSAYYGEPSYYELRSPTSGGVQIHPSRVVRFQGVEQLEIERSFDGWGFSILQRVHDVVRNAAATPHAIALLAQEAKFDVIKIKNLTQNALDPTYRRQVMARFGLANEAKGLVNMLVLDAEEDWTQKKADPNGWPAVIHAFLEIAAGAADMPVTRLLGAPPKGLNATGENDIRNYYDMLSAQQETKLRPALHRLDEVLIRSATGSGSANVGYVWRPLWQVRESERVAMDLQRGQTADIYASLGVMPPAAMRAAIVNRLREDGTYPGLDTAIEAAGTEAPAPLIARAERVETKSPNTNAAKS